MKNSKNIGLKIYKKSLLIGAISLYAGILSPQVHANTSEPSLLNRNYSLNLSANRMTVKDAIEKISKQSGVRIIYSNDQVDENRVIETDISTTNIEEALTKVLGNGYKLKQDGNYITIVKTGKELSTAPSAAQQKQVTIKGLVTDADGNPIIGATIMVKGSTTGVITDIDGRYSIKANVGGTLVFNYIGYNTEEVKIKSNAPINVRMMESSVSLDDVVVIGYGQQKKTGVVSSVNSVGSKEIKAPVRNLTNNLAGQIAGIIAIQRNGEPGNDNAEFWIRGTSSFAGGTSPLVLVDGAPRSMQDIEPDEIESFTVLKDAAATAVYGAEGANGVILITSKRGKVEKAKVSFRGEVSMATPTRLPEMLSSADHMRLYNEARRNDGLAEEYTEELIQKYESGEDLDLYPNTNWFDMLKKHTFNQRYTLNVRGGSERAKYFVSGAYFSEQGIFKNNKLEEYDSNIGLNRYNLRSNIDIDVTKSTLLSIDLSGQYSQLTSPGTDSNTIFTKLSYSAPHLTPMYYSDGSVASPLQPTGNITNPYNLLTHTGYQKKWTTSIQSTIKLEQKLDFITKGLKWMGRISFDNYSVYSMKRTKTASAYHASGRDENGNLILEKVIKGNDSLSDPTESNSGDKKIYIETQLSYNRLFANKHNVSMMLLYMQKEKQLHNEALAYRKQSFVGRGSYSFDERYFIEGSFGYTGSETFAKNHRFGFFPAVGVAYLLTNEHFISDSFKDVVNKIKIRASIGRTGNDNTGGARFLYRETLKTDAGGYNIGIGANGGLNGVGNGIIENNFAAPNLMWEIESKRNLGFDLGLFNNKIDIQFDYFDNKRTDILLQRKTLPSLTGFRVSPWENYGIVTNKGCDASLIMNEKVGDLRMTFRGNFTFARNKVIEYDEVPQKYEWMNVTGTRLNRLNLLIAEGLYTFDDFNITENPDGTKNYKLKEGLPVSTKGATKPGDIKLKDLNGDGVIDDFDVVKDAANPTVPEIVYGFGLNLDYKGFYASVFFQGTGNVSTVLGQANGPGFHPFAWGDRTSGTRIQALDRWTEENPRQDVLYPRLSSSSNFNNRANSTWWLRDASFIRLKNIELGYNFKKSIAQKMHMQAARIYLMGYNVAVWDKIKLWDPEMGNKNDGMSYPLPRTFTFGLEVTF